MKKTILQLCIIIILLNSMLVYSAEDDFFAGSDSVLSACACQVKQDRIYIENTGILTSTYHVELSGQASDWSALAPSDFVLQKGDEGIVDVLINVPCDASGIYGLETNIKTNYGTEKALSQVLDVTKCDNLLLGATDLDQESCPCTPTVYEFKVTNVANFPEIYDFSVDDHAEFISLSEASVVLGPDESKSIFLFINSPCDFAGELNFNFFAHAVKNDLWASMPVKYSSLACFDYNVKIPKKIQSCADVQKLVPFTVYNNATLRNSYLMTFESPEFVDLLTNGTSARMYSFALPGQAFTEYTLVIETSEPGSYDLNMTFVSSRGNIQKEYSSKIQIDKCHDSALVISPEKVQSVQCETAKAYIWIQNRGKESTSYQLELNAPEDVRISSDSLDFGPNESRTFELISDICEPGLYDISVTVKDTKYNISVSDSVIFDVMSTKDATMVDLDTYGIRTYFEDKTFNITLSHKGFVNGSYKAWAIIDNTTDNLTWINIFPKSFNLDVNETRELTLRVSPIFNHTNIPNAYVGDHKLKIFVGTANDNYEFDSNIRLVKRLKWEMDLEMNWIWIIFIFLLILLLILFIVLMLKKDVKDRPKKAKPLKIARKKKRKPFNWKKFWNFVLVILYTILIGLAFVFFPLYALYILIGLVLLGLWIISRERKKKKKQRKKRSNLFYYLLILLLGLILIIAAFIYLFSLAPPMQQNVTENISVLNETVVEEPEKDQRRQEMFELLNHIYKEDLNGTYSYQIWDVNTNHTMELSKNYKDPDGDELVFSYVPMENISVEISKSLIKFIPQKDWFGIQYTTLSASDGTFNISGPNMTLIVKEPGVYDEFQKSQFEFNAYFLGVIDFIKNYWIYFLIGILMLLVIIMFLENDDKPPKPRK